MKNKFVLMFLLMPAAVPAIASASIKCFDYSSNSNYFLIAEDLYGEAGSKVTFGKTATYDASGPKVFEHRYSWGSGGEIIVPGRVSVQYTADYEYFGSDNDLHQFALDFLKVAGDAYPPYILLKVASGQGDSIIYKLNCAQTVDVTSP